MNIEGLKAMKESRVAGSKGVEGDDDLTPMVEVYRDGEIVAMIVAPNVNRDEGLHAAQVAAAGFGADRISMVVDAHMAKAPINPKTGQEWGPGEMQKACHEDAACEVGLITDCLLVIDHWRTGRNRQEILPYHVHASAKTVRWVQDPEMKTIDTDEPGAMTAGIVPDAIREGFARPLLLDKMAELFEGDFGLTPEEQRIHADCAMAKLLGQDGFQVALVPQTDRAAEIISRSLDVAAL